MSDPSIIAVSTLLVATSVSLLVTPAVIRLALWIGAVDQPNARKVHGRPIPRIGGISVFLGFITGLLYAAHASGDLYEHPKVTVYWSVFAGSATAVFLLGLADDVWRLSYRTKFLFQILAVLAIWGGGFRIVQVSHPFQEGVLTFPWWISLPITLLWVVGITNAMNLIDGLDGLAAGTALIITTSLACIAFIQNRTGVVAVSVALVGSLLGFLFFNFNPAKIFLGDSGSMFLGFVLAVMSIRGSQKGPAAVAVLIPLLIMALPILDTSMALTRRYFRIRRSSVEQDRGPFHWMGNMSHLFLPDRGHIHHRLIDLGYSHRSAVLILYGLVLTMALAALALVIAQSRYVAAVLVGALALCLALFVLLNVLFRARSVLRSNRKVSGPDDAK